MFKCPYCQRVPCKTIYGLKIHVTRKHRGFVFIRRNASRVLTNSEHVLDMDDLLFAALHYSSRRTLDKTNKKKATEIIRERCEVE